MLLHKISFALGTIFTEGESSKYVYSADNVGMHLVTAFNANKLTLSYSILLLDAATRRRIE